MAKDSLGNELKVGDMVQIRITDPFIYGHIVEIHPGGISLIRGPRRGHENEQQVEQGRVVCQTMPLAFFNPANGIAGAIVKVQDPAESEDRQTGLLKPQ